MEIASGWRERTHKDKAFIVSQIGNLHPERTHSEDRLCYQLVAAIFSPISANFEWIASSRLLNCELSRVGTERRASQRTLDTAPATDLPPGGSGPKTDQYWAVGGRPMRVKPNQSQQG